MANLVDNFFGAFQKAAGYNDRRRQVQGQLQMQDMAAAEFNNKQRDRAMGDFGSRTTQALGNLQNDGSEKFKNTDRAGYFADKGASDYGIQDFLDVYGEERTKDILNSIGFGAGSLGKNKFITGIKVYEDEDGTKKAKVDVGTYEKDGEGSNYVYSERFTGEGKKRADGGVYYDIDIERADDKFRAYTYGVRKAGGGTPEISLLTDLEQHPFEMYKRVNDGSVDTAASDAAAAAAAAAAGDIDNQAGDNQGFGLTYSNPTGGVPVKNPLPEGDALMAMLPGFEMADPLSYGRGVGPGGMGSTQQIPLLKTPPEGFDENFIETNPDVPFGMTQSQFDSLTDAQQVDVIQASKMLTDRTIKRQTKEILLPEGSSVVTGGGAISKVRSDAMDYKDGKKTGGAGLSNTERKARKDANKFYADNEGEIYSWLQNNPEAFKEFKEDPIAFANNPKYNKRGKLINPTSAKDRARMLSHKGTDSEADQTAVAEIISQNINTNTGNANLRGYGRKARINMKNTVLGSLDPALHDLYAPMLNIFVEEGIMTLDPGKVNIQRQNAATNAAHLHKAGQQYTDDSTSFIDEIYGTGKFIETGALSTRDYGKMAGRIQTRINNAENLAQVNVMAAPTALLLRKFAEDRGTSGFLNSILSLSIFNGTQDEAGFDLEPNVRVFKEDGTRATTAAEISYLQVVGQKGTIKGGTVDRGQLQTIFGTKGLELYMQYALNTAKRSK